MRLSVELEKSQHPEVAICFDRKGIDLLIRKLEKLRDTPGHTHLMTPSWAGDDLTEVVVGGDKNELVHSLRLVRLMDSE
jgi:hypothetical protein